MSSIRSVLIFLTLVACSQSVFGQGDPKETAREYMTQAELVLESTKALDLARDLVVNAANLDTTFIKANYQAGSMHLQTINKGDAAKYFLRVYRQDPNYRFDIEYLIGKAYQYGLDFNRAIDFYTRYKEKLAKKANYQGKDKVDMAIVDRAIFECETGKEFVANPGNFSIVNMGREINSEYEDYAPVLNENEDEIVFTTRRRDDNLNQNVADDNKPWEDIFIATRAKGSVWSYAKNIGTPVNTPYHNSNLALSADGGTLFIFNDEGGGDIFFSELNNGVWSEPAPLPGLINSSFGEKSITISSDEKTLYFSSNRPGGFGGYDLYKATKDTKGDWSNIKNLGPTINTDVDDDGPFIAYDNVTLYFSSKGRKGMGGFDVFKSVFDPKTNKWSEPENMGYPINTPDDDIYFVSSKDGKRQYYSSVREDGMGYTDIYMVTEPDPSKPKTTPPPVAKTEPKVATPVDTAATTKPNTVASKDPVTNPTTNPTNTKPLVDPSTQVKKDPTKEPVKKDPVVKTEPKKDPVKEPVVEPKKEPTTVPSKFVVTVRDSKDGSPLNAKVRLVGAKDNVIVGGVDKGNGVYEFTIPKTKEYRLSVDNEGYMFLNEKVKLSVGPEEKVVNRTVDLRKLTVNASSILRNLYFDFDKATFETESYTELNKLEAMMRSNQNLIVEIAGHTDAIGTKAYNMYLSQRRAEAVKDYLTKKGVDTRRIKAVGYGKSKPLASNDDEADGRELNRRVEFRVLAN